VQVDPLLEIGWSILHRADNDAIRDSQRGHNIAHRLPVEPIVRFMCGPIPKRLEDLRRAWLEGQHLGLKCERRLVTRNRGQRPQRLLGTVRREPDYTFRIGNPRRHVDAECLRLEQFDHRQGCPGRIGNDPHLILGCFREVLIEPPDNIARMQPADPLLVPW
jgi:hypothetical protein